MKLFIFISTIFFLLWGTVFATDPVSVVAPYRFGVEVQNDTLYIPFYRSKPLYYQYTAVTRAVILIHGATRNANTYYSTLQTAASHAYVPSSNIILIAPQFLVEVDISAHNLPSNILFWSTSGWKIGHKSKSTTSHPRPFRISSFAVMDSLLYLLASNNPNLQTIVVAGHSAGGQYVNRYAAGSPMIDYLKTHFGITVRCVVANPSSYLYFNSERHVQGSYTQFAVPPYNVIQACPTYNQYRYGLEGLNSYMSSVGATQIRAQYPGRNVIYLLGEEDTNPNDPWLDVSCAAMLQGSQRLERGIIYFNFLKYYFGNTIFATQELAIIPGVGHSHSGIYLSDCGLYYLFDYGSCPTVSVSRGESDQQLPGRFRLGINYPNPFNSRTILPISLPRPGSVTIEIIDVQGKVVRPALHRFFLTGVHTIPIEMEHLPGGIYFIRARWRNHYRVRKVLLLK